VTRQRLYLDTMQAVLTNSSKVLVDVQGGNNMLYLPLDKIMSQPGGGDSSAAARPMPATSRSVSTQAAPTSSI